MIGKRKKLSTKSIKSKTNIKTIKYPQIPSIKKLQIEQNQNIFKYKNTNMFLENLSSQKYQIKCPLQFRKFKKKQHLIKVVQPNHIYTKVQKQKQIIDAYKPVIRSKFKQYSSSNKFNKKKEKVSLINRQIQNKLTKQKNQKKQTKIKRKKLKKLKNQIQNKSYQILSNQDINSLRNQVLKLQDYINNQSNLSVQNYQSQRNHFNYKDSIIITQSSDNDIFSYNYDNMLINNNSNNYLCHQNYSINTLQNIEKYQNVGKLSNPISSSNLVSLPLSNMEQLFSMGESSDIMQSSNILSSSSNNDHLQSFNNGDHLLLLQNNPKYQLNNDHLGSLNDDYLQQMKNSDYLQQFNNSDHILTYKRQNNNNQTHLLNQNHTLLFDEIQFYNISSQNLLAQQSYMSRSIVQSISSFNNTFDIQNNLQSQQQQQSQFNAVQNQHSLGQQYQQQQQQQQEQQQQQLSESIELDFHSQSFSILTDNSKLFDPNLIQLCTYPINSINNQQKCSICLDQYQNGQSIRITKCHHLFHQNCFDQWAYYHENCPVCRCQIYSIK